MSNRQKKRVRVSLRTRTIAAMSIALPLVLLGWMFILQVMQNGLRRQIQEDFTFTLFLDKEIKDNQVQAVIHKLKEFPAIKSVHHITSDMAAEEVKKELQEDPIKVLGYNPFYPSLELNLRAEYANQDSLPKIDSLIRTLGGVDNFEYRGDLVGKVDSVINRITMGLFVAVIIMLVIAILQMSNTTHLLIYARRFLIRSMTLLGAPYSLICRPILRTALLNGFWGGLFADLLVALSMWITYHYLGEDIMQFLQGIHLAIVAIGLPLISMIFSLLTALIATRRYIRMDGSRMILG